MAKNLSDLGLILKNEYNIELIYLIMPDKLSVYRDYLKNENIAESYIPKINSKLRERNLNVIDIYADYLNYRSNDDAKLLYYASDTHFTAFGKERLVLLTEKMIQGLPQSYNTQN